MEAPWLVVTPDMRLVYVSGTRDEAATEGRVLRRATHWELHQSHWISDSRQSGKHCTDCVASGWQSGLAWV